MSESSISPVAGCPVLVVRTRRLPVPPSAGPGGLLSLVPARTPAETVSWVRRGEGMVGWGRVASVDTDGPDRFARAEQWWTELVARAQVESSWPQGSARPAGAGLVAFGSFAFADDSRRTSTLVVPQVVVGHRDGTWWVTTCRVAGGPEPEAASAGYRLTPAGSALAPQAVVFSDGDMSAAAYATAVAAGIRHITEGELSKVVLARDLVASAQAPIDPRWLLGRLAGTYERTWVFCVDGLLGATPEMLIRRDHRLVTSRVLAGTIPRTGDDAHDLALAATLARSSKDLEEHEYAVRSVANSLAPHCSSMNVPEAPFVLHLPNVMHLASDVAGVSSDEASVLTLAAALHPSAAVGGAPTTAAVALISRLEQMDRERYAGPVGWVDADGDGEFGIALRCGAFDQRDGSTIRLFAGCGIMAGSVPESEVAESDAKLVPMRDALTS